MKIEKINKRLGLLSVVIFVSTVIILAFFSKFQSVAFFRMVSQEEFILNEKIPIILYKSSLNQNISVSPVNSLDRIDFPLSAKSFFLNYHVVLVFDTDKISTSTPTTYYTLVSHISGSMQKFLGEMNVKEVKKSADFLYVAFFGTKNTTTHLCVRELIFKNDDACYSVIDLLNNKGYRNREVIKYDWEKDKDHSLIVQTKNFKNEFEYFSYDPWSSELIHPLSFEEIKSLKLENIDFQDPDYNIEITRFGFLTLKSRFTDKLPSLIVPVQAEQYWWISRSVLILRSSKGWYILHPEKRIYSKIVNNLDELFFSAKDRIVPSLSL